MLVKKIKEFILLVPNFQCNIRYDNFGTYRPDPNKDQLYVVFTRGKSVHPPFSSLHLNM